ncbi:amidohydrolase [Nonomuraea sp. KC401]|uniref:Amidohydrolase n=1 Tax=Nonomuraea longispora TaxID=1848320 RepID=A0A4R4NGL7_9ACTN|nr:MULTISPECIES: amidohydrolase family protein [Nonomuraea]NBE93724.1 amidohydrolase family protein [Nonomuraea sp. K271]TDC08159.1 amidohydrolase [Nonomuraea longispora]TLF76987.1 amidohydrolase [Nonomuraea sp. KC401]
MTGPWRIDTHNHAVPPKMQRWAVQAGILPPDQSKWPTWARWSQAATEQVMEENDIAAAVTSSPAPFEVFKDTAQVATGARVINESLADLVREQPQRFGFFAYLPLTDVDAALAEADYALGTLGAEGVLLLTHVNGTYLGDPSFEPLFAELDRRRAVLFVHPQFLPGGTPPGIPDFMGDFLLDTTRAALSLMIGGTLERHRNLSVILSHGGGFLPYMAARIDSRSHDEEGVDPATLRSYVRRFYYDTAMPTSPYATPTLLAAADHSRILYGTDYSMRTAEATRYVTDGLAGDPVIGPQLHRAIERDNALRLLPSLAERMSVTV